LSEPRDESKPLAMFSLNGRLKGRERHDGTWECFGNGGAPGRPGCCKTTLTFHELLTHGQEFHGWPKPADCPHPQFDARVAVARILDAGAYVAEIMVNCGVCGVPMRFKGVPAGVSCEQPMTSITSEELLAPMEPALESRFQSKASYRVPTIPRRH
jgi:hypothetical protein